MSWVEELTPDDEVNVEIILPKAYVDMCVSTMKKYAKGIAHLCKGAALLGDDDTEFLVFDILIEQVLCIEEVMRHFGVEMTHESGKLSDGTRYTYFYADLTELKEMLENGELESM